MSLVLGIDIGGTGIKAGVVDIETGELVTERKRILTPKPGDPASILKVLKELVELFEWTGKPIGIGFPTLVKNGICRTANNIDKSWIGVDMNNFFSEGLQTNVTIINDADAAGVAEWHLLKKEGKYNDVLLLTLGTGVGSCLIIDKKIILNLELGGLNYRKGIVEDYVSNSARVEKELSYEKWGKELNKFLQNMEKVFSPELIIIGGGVCKKIHKYEEYLDTDCDIKPAQLLNAAGVIGAALATKL